MKDTNQTKEISQIYEAFFDNAKDGILIKEMYIVFTLMKYLYDVIAINCLYNVIPCIRKYLFQEDPRLSIVLSDEDCFIASIYFY